MNGFNAALRHYGLKSAEELQGALGQSQVKVLDPAMEAAKVRYGLSSAFEANSLQGAQSIENGVNTRAT